MDINQLLETLKKRYPNGSPYRKIDDLIAANEDLLEGLVQLRNRSNAMFNMPAEMYLKTQGILSTTRVGEMSNAEEWQRTRMLNRVLEQLEAYYPEHKVFALDSIDSGLRERVSTLTKGMGYSSVDQFLLDQGFELISGEEVKKIRNMVIYSPGNEPKVIQSNIQSMLKRLAEYYPDHIIPRGLQTDHKKLSQSVSGLYQWLGYEDAKAMLEAYGYEYRLGGAGSGGSGRPVNDYQPMIDALVVKYRDGRKPRTIAELQADNPEYAGAIKTLQNSAKDRFGMGLSVYFERLGIIGYSYSSSNTLETIPSTEAQTAQTTSSQSDWRADRRRQTVEDRRHRMEELTEELQKRYPEGTTLPTTLWELRRDNKDLPLGSAESWAKIAFDTTLAVYLRERHLLGDNALAAGHRAARLNQLVSNTSESTTEVVARKPVRSRESVDQERVDSVVEELKKRYPDYGSEGSLAELKRQNPDLNINSLTGPIKRLTGLTPTNYFKKLKFVVSISLWDLGLDYETIWSLQNAGVSYLGQLLRLAPERLNTLSGIGAERRIKIQSVINKCRVLYNVGVEELGLSNRVLRTLQNNNVFAAIEIINGGQNLSGIGPTSSEEINNCITRFVQDHFQKIYGNVRLEELDISKRVLSALGKHGIVFAYEAVDGCIDLAGIGPSSATEILNALSEYIKNRPETEECIEEETPEAEETLSEEELAAIAAEVLAKRTEEARNLLNVFIDELQKRYQSDSEKEHLMIHLRQKNSDLSFEDAHEWCRLVFDKPLKDYLQECGILLLDEDVPSTKQEHNVVQKRQHLLKEDSADDAVVLPEFHISSLQKRSTASALAERVLDQSSIEDYPVADFSIDYINNCVAQDTAHFTRYVEQNNLPYSLESVPGFMRSLHRREISEFLLRAHKLSYSEYLVFQGLIPGKTIGYWKEQLLQYLNSNYISCGGGMLIYSEASFEYDPIRDIVKICSPLYETHKRISNIQVAEKFGGKLALQPCYCKDNHAYDVALTSNGEIVGQLNKTLFRSVGLGLYLSPLLNSKSVLVKSIRLSSDDYPNVIFELQFR